MDGLIVQDLFIQMVECSACSIYDPIKHGMYFETTTVSKSHMNFSESFNLCEKRIRDLGGTQRIQN